MTDPDNLPIDPNQSGEQEGDHGLPEEATQGFDVNTEDDADAEPGTDDPGEPHDGDPVDPDDLEDDDDAEDDDEDH